MNDKMKIRQNRTENPIMIIVKTMGPRNASAAKTNQRVYPIFFLFGAFVFQPVHSIDEQIFMVPMAVFGAEIDENGHISEFIDCVVRRMQFSCEFGTENSEYNDHSEDENG